MNLNPFNRSNFVLQDYEDTVSLGSDDDMDVQPESGHLVTHLEVENDNLSII